MLSTNLETQNVGGGYGYGGFGGLGGFGLVGLIGLNSFLGGHRGWGDGDGGGRGTLAAVDTLGILTAVGNTKDAVVAEGRTTQTQLNSVETALTNGMYNQTAFLTGVVANAEARTAAGILNLGTRAEFYQNQNNAEFRAIGKDLCCISNSITNLHGRVGLSEERILGAIRSTSLEERLYDTQLALAACHRRLDHHDIAEKVTQNIIQVTGAGNNTAGQVAK